MGKQRTIFDLFRQEDEQFTSQPSNDAWSKLERKLDGEKEVVPVRRINWWTIAASLVALVGAVFILQMSSNKTANSAFAENKLMEESSAFYVEDLVFTDSDSEFQKEWQVSNEYRALLADNTPDFQRNENLAYIGNAEIKPRINQKPSIRDNQNLIAENEKNDNSTNSIAKHSPTNKAFFKNKTLDPSANSPIKEKITANQSINHDQQQEDAGNISTTIMDSPIPSKSVRKKKPESKNTNDLKNLRWLVGTWEQKRADLKSVEKWVSDSSNVIWGTGYLLQEDDTIFTENMCIKEIDDKIYFFQNIDTVNEQTQFVLSSNTKNNWNFTNSGGAPKNLIISNASDSKYNFEIQEIAPTQTHFLRKRNILQSNNAFRQMNKVDK